MEKIAHLIDGRPVESAETFVSVDPYQRAAWAEVALGGAAEAQAALLAARRAFDHGPWPRMTRAHRSAVLYRLADLLEANASDLARRDSRDAGKPYAAVAGSEVGSAAGDLRNYADLARLATSPVYPRDDGNHVYAHYPAAGVVVAVTPWNFPVPMAMSKVGPALAWGNTVVLKPAEQTPASATLLAELALEAGVPAGAFNVVHGYGAGGVGEHLTSSPLADRVTFTGSTAAGAAIAASAGRNLTPVLLECGGKSANIVFADADLDRAVELSALGAFSNSGQVCVAASRLYVERAAYPEVLAGVVARASATRIGDPMDPATNLGPLASEEQYHRVLGYLHGIPADGGTIVAGGDVGEGWFVGPTVVTGLGPQARACREEIFGPVVIVTPFDTEAEVVELANDSRYGLSASLFTLDSRRAFSVAEQLRAGIVWVNTFGVRDWRAPFGGYRQSGLGREGGDSSRAFYTEPTTIVMSHP